MPTHVRIETFDHPATNLLYPAVTICKKHNYDVAEYLRFIFDNFDASQDLLLQDHFRKLLKFNLSRVTNMHLLLNLFFILTHLFTNRTHIIMIEIPGSRILTQMSA